MLARSVIACIALCVGCSDPGKSSKPTKPSGSAGAGSATAGSEGGATGAVPAAVASHAPALDDNPTIDLISNRFRWHLYAPGLVIPVGSEGFRKYTQEYSQPWGDVVEVDGKRGRLLPARAATLRFPSDRDGERQLIVRMYGVANGQRLSLRLNGESAGNLSPGTGWQVLTRKVNVRKGENELVVSLAKRGQAGGASAYAAFHSIELADAEPAAEAAWPRLTPVAQATVGGTPREALTGFSRMAIYLEVPEKAHLVVETGAPAATKIAITADPLDGEPVTLLEADQPAAWSSRTISLAALAGKVVRLELSSEGNAAWANARIALEHANRAERPAPYKNAILVVVDALRADRLAVNGKTRVQTPRITKAAESGVVFRNNQAASPSSPPSHGSIQTGMIPRVHGVTGDKAQLAPGTPMISTQLVDAGISAGYYGNNAFGMGRLEKPGRWTEFHQPAQEGLGIDCTALIPEMLKFADAQVKAGKRFFISSLPYEPHVPYRYHPQISDRYFDGPWGDKVGKTVTGDDLGAISSGRKKLSERELAQLVALYDGEVEYFDGCFGTLLDGLKERGLTDSTLVIVTSDHGEGMFEHGRMGHAFGHYAELANIPLVFIAPNLVTRGRTIETVTSHLDIVPTILDLMGVPRSPKIQGQSLVPMMLRDGPAIPRVMPLEYGRSYALRGTRWKYIVDYGGQESVFDLATDPTEQNDLVAKKPEALRYLRDIAGFFLAHRSQWHMEQWGTLDNHSAAFVKDVTR